MSNTVDMHPVEYAAKTRAVLIFGPATPNMGSKPADFYQAVIDPNMVSPNGKLIRFGHYSADEIIGWQSVDAMTVVEVLGEVDQAVSLKGYVEKPGASVTLRTVK